MQALQQELSNSYHGLCNYMSKDTNGSTLFIYGTSGILLAIAYIKRRPVYLIRQFKKPSHIADKLINDRIIHKGVVRDIKQINQNTILLIKHRPLIPIFISDKKLLKIKLPGVNVTANGFAWLQNCVVGREAKFLPIEKTSSDNYVISQLNLVLPPQGNKSVDISETLLKLRFAKFAANQNDVDVNNPNAVYYKRLQKVEKDANTKEVWKSRIVVFPWLWKKYNDLKAIILPKNLLLPELVR